MLTSNFVLPLEQYDILRPIEVSDVPFILGYLLSFGLLGVLSAQVFTYASRPNLGSKWLKFTVFSVIFLELFNSVLVLYSAIFGAKIRCLSCLVTGEQGNVLNGVLVPAKLSTWAFQALCVLTGLSSSIVQVFYAWRIWNLGKTLWIPAVIIVASLAQCILLMTGGILSSTDPDFGVFDTKKAVIWLIISAFCNIIITVRTVQLVFRGRDKSDYQANQSFAGTFVKITIETGLVIVVAVLLEFTIAETLNIAHYAVFYFLSKLYAICLLTTLNAQTATHEQVRRRTTISVFKPSDIQLTSTTDGGAWPEVTTPVLNPAYATISSTASFRRGLYEPGLGLRKTLSVPVLAQTRTRSITTGRSCHSVGVQSGGDKEVRMDPHPRPELNLDRMTSVMTGMTCYYSVGAQGDTEVKTEEEAEAHDLGTTTPSEHEEAYGGDEDETSSSIASSAFILPHDEGRSEAWSSIPPLVLDADLVQVAGQKDANVPATTTAGDETVYDAETSIVISVISPEGPPAQMEPSDPIPAVRIIAPEDVPETDPSVSFPVVRIVAPEDPLAQTEPSDPVPTVPIVPEEPLAQAEPSDPIPVVPVVAPQDVSEQAPASPTPEPVPASQPTQPIRPATPGARASLLFSRLLSQSMESIHLPHLPGSFPQWRTETIVREIESEVDWANERWRHMVAFLTDGVA